MNRRSFLTLSGLASGSILIPATLARRIRETCIGNQQPLILAPEEAGTTLYAVENYGSYILHLGDPNEEPNYPTLREFIEDRGFNPKKDKSLRAYLIEFRGEEDFDEKEEGAIRSLKEELDEQIDGYERDHWMEWDFERRDSPMARAFHYLNRLPLDGGSGGNDGRGFQLGDLRFVEGDRPGSNLTYIEADEHATALGEGTSAYEACSGGGMLFLHALHGGPVSSAGLAAVL
jgi:hypothetical protein